MDDSTLQIVLASVGSLIIGIFGKDGILYFKAFLNYLRGNKDEEREDTHLYRDDLRAKVTKLENDIVELLREMGDLKAKIGRLEGQGQILKRENESLREENANQNRRILELETEKELLHAENDELRAKIDAINCELHPSDSEN